MRNEKKRKRRSFWEPESPVLLKWLEEQNDLGTSLQLIIVDAIHKYGEGDVIKAHLNQRELAYPEQESRTVAPQPISDAPELPAPVKAETPVPSEPKPVRKPATDKIVVNGKPIEEQRERQETQPTVKRQERQVEQAQSEQAQNTEPKQAPDTTESELDMASELARYQEEEAKLQEQATPKQNDEDDYDPIEIMMGDIGSRFQK